MTIPLLDDIWEHNLLNSQIYLDFLEATENMDECFKTEFYLEKVTVDPAQDKWKQGLDNTKETTKKAFKAYDDATDAGGAIAKTTWNTSFTFIGFIAKICKFISKVIVNIVSIITNTIKFVAKIPSNIITKIRGDIKLYVTAQDVQIFYNNMLPDIYAFIQYAQILSQGDNWNMHLTGQLNLKSIKNKVLDFLHSKPKDVKNDMDLYQAMKTIETRLSKYSFELTTVKMDTANVNLYFGQEKFIKFATTSGPREFSYFEGIHQIFSELSKENQNDFSIHKGLEEVRKFLEDKFQKSQANQTFFQLSEKQQNIVRDTIMMISRVSSLIGKFSQYVLKDLNTIKSNTQRIKEKMDKTTKKTTKGNEEGT